MPVVLKIRHFDHDGVADGGKFEKEWTADFDYTVKYILPKRKDGAAFTKSDITIRIAGDPITVDHALCNTFGTDKLNALPIDEDLLKDQVIEYEGYNREGVTLDIVVELVLVKK